MSFTGSTMGKYSRLWLFVIGIIMLVLGISFIVGLGWIPFAGGAMVLTGGILAAVGIALIVVGIIVSRRAAAVDQILTTGTAGTAQVTGVTQTGMYLNEQPQLDLQLMVSIPGKAPYPARHKSFVPLMLMGRVTSGQPLAVRVDPMDPQKLVVDWQSSGFASAPMGMPMAGAMPMTGAAPAATTFSGVDESLEPGPGSAGGKRRGGGKSLCEPGTGQLLGRAAARVPAPVGPAWRGDDRQAHGHRQDRGRRAPVHDGCHAPHPGAAAAVTGRGGCHGSAYGDAQGSSRSNGAGQVRRRQPQSGDVRMGQDLVG